MAQSTFAPSQTSFTAPVLAGDSQVILASLTGITPGTALYINREQMMVDRATGIGNAVVVRRGQNGTATRPHSTGDVVWYGSPDWFFQEDPQGQALNPVRVQPHINVLTGDVWYVQGDEDGPGAALRTWQKATTSQQIGALGVRVNSTVTPS